MKKPVEYLSTGFFVPYRTAFFKHITLR